MTEPAESSAAPVIERRIVVAPGVELHVEVRVGNRAAAPFVLVHGLASNARLWDGVAEHLQRPATRWSSSISAATAAPTRPTPAMIWTPPSPTFSR